MKAREFLAQEVGDGLVLRHIVKEPLSKGELRTLAGKVGGLEALIAPKRKKEAEGKKGEALLEWLASDGGNLRRPIVIVGRTVTLGFAGDAREKLQEIL
jgi:arsenate reductase-like glutaredoxin family protein